MRPTLSVRHRCLGRLTAILVCMSPPFWNGRPIGSRCFCLNGSSTSWLLSNGRDATDVGSEGCIGTGEEIGFLRWGLQMVSEPNKCGVSGMFRSPIKGGTGTNTEHPHRDTASPSSAPAASLPLFPVVPFLGFVYFVRGSYFSSRTLFFFFPFFGPFPLVRQNRHSYTSRIPNLAPSSHRHTVSSGPFENRSQRLATTVYCGSQDNNVFARLPFDNCPGEECTCSAVF